MSVHSSPSVSMQREVTLSPWIVLECDDGNRYLVGFSVEDFEGRVSTPIQEFDRTVMSARTKSGRLYRLSGPPALDADAKYIWDLYAVVNGLRVTRDASGDYYQGWTETRFVDTRAEALARAMRMDGANIQAAETKADSKTTPQRDDRLSRKAPRVKRRTQRTRRRQAT